MAKSQTPAGSPAVRRATPTPMAAFEEMGVAARSSARAEADAGAIEDANPSEQDNIGDWTAASEAVAFAADEPSPALSGEPEIWGSALDGDDLGRELELSDMVDGGEDEDEERAHEDSELPGSFAPRQVQRGSVLIGETPIRQMPSVTDLLERVPRATLDPPSTRLVEPTPSPVPLASLAPATAIPRTATAEAVLPPAGVVSAVVPPSSRHLPTQAARHLQLEPFGTVAAALARRPAVWPPQRGIVPAVTLPPGARLARPSRFARQIATDVRSSKREILIGLSIGIALSAVLGLLGQAYLDRRLEAVSRVPLAPSPTPPSAAPGAAGGLRSAARANALEGVPGPYRDDDPIERQVSALRPAPEATRAPTLEARGRQELAADPEAIGPLAARGEIEEYQPAARAKPKRKSPSKAGGAVNKPPRPRAHVAQSRLESPVELPVGSLAPLDAPVVAAGTQPEAPPRSAAPLSPAQSAGLGLDVPF